MEYLTFAEMFELAVRSLTYGLAASALSFLTGFAFRNILKFFHLF